MTDLTGSTLGQYHLHDMIGHGGMADVYVADQASIGRQVAIKVLPAHFLQDRTFLQRFMQEVKVIAGLQHPHILPVYDFGENDGMPYIVMAYLTGGSLADRIQREGGLPLPDIVRLVQQITDGLAYAHENGIIHRDFKPSNVLLDGKGNAYLADFGIAKITESTAQLTGSGVVGTPAYMAPEMAQRDGVSTLVDVYALGITLYQMLTGRQPYEADTPMGVLMAHMSQPIPDAREVRPDLPDGVQTVIERAMAKDPMDRYQTPGELAEAFAAAASGQAIRAAEPQPRTIRDEATLVEERVPYDAATIPEFHTPPHPPAPAPLPKVEKPPRKRMPWLIPAIGGVLALIALMVGILVVPGLINPGTAAVPTTTQKPIPTEMPAASEPTPLPEVVEPDLRRGVAVVLDGPENDRSFNQLTMEGARAAADQVGIPFGYTVAASPDEFEPRIRDYVKEGYGLIITVGFRMADMTGAMANEFPDTHFAIVDFNFEQDPPNVTGLVFAEDQAGYLAGVLAGCMTQTNVIGTVSGMEIAPVQRYVIGFQNGARSVNANVETLNTFIMDFNAPDVGGQVAREQIAQGADVIFGVGGDTGNGGLMVAHEAGLMAIGVDVDQFFTFPDAAPSMITSAVKRIDVAVGNTVRLFAEGNLHGGPLPNTMQNDGVGLAPYHEWDGRIPQHCKEQIDVAREGLATGNRDTGWHD